VSGRKTVPDTFDSSLIFLGGPVPVFFDRARPTPFSPATGWLHRKSVQQRRTLSGRDRRRGRHKDGANALQKLGIAEKHERAGDQIMIAPETENRFTVPHTLAVNYTAPLLEPTWMFVQMVQVIPILVGGRQERGLADCAIFQWGAKPHFQTRAV